MMVAAGSRPSTAEPSRYAPREPISEPDKLTPMEVTSVIAILRELTPTRLTKLTEQLNARRPTTTAPMR